MNINREQAIELLHEYVKTEHIITHSYAVEAVMRALAKKLAPEDVELWGIAGLLHDLDEDVCGWREDMSKHGPMTVDILKERGLGNQQLYDAILAHNPENGKKASNPFETALYAADPMSGFINAIALGHTDKKLASVKVKSIVKRMKETRFAAGANREAMWSIEHVGVEFTEFAELALESMNEISEVLGL